MASSWSWPLRRKWSGTADYCVLLFCTPNVAVPTNSLLPDSGVIFACLTSELPDCYVESKCSKIIFLYVFGWIFLLLSVLKTVSTRPFWFCISDKVNSISETCLWTSLSSFCLILRPNCKMASLSSYSVFSWLNLVSKFFLYASISEKTYWAILKHWLSVCSIFEFARAEKSFKSSSLISRLKTSSF